MIEREREIRNTSWESAKWHKLDAFVRITGKFIAIHIYEKAQQTMFRKKTNKRQKKDEEKEEEEWKLVTIVVYSLWDPPPQKNKPFIRTAMAIIYTVAQHNAYNNNKK